MRPPAKPLLLNAVQAAFVIALLAAIAGMAITAHDNLLRQNIATGFRFLWDRTGWDVSASSLPQSEADPYWWTFLVGLTNTLILSLLCILLATLFGLVLALAGAGRSRIPHTLTRGYIWLFRNTPIIVQVFFWYDVTRSLPAVRQAHELLGCCYASNRGVYLPSLGFSATWTRWIGLAVTVLATVAAVQWVNRRRVRRSNDPLSRIWRTAVPLAVAAVGAAALLHIEVTAPRLQGFNFVGGTYLSPEFAALVVAIVAYNTAFIAEIVNSGIRSIPRSQNEAARIIGLSASRTFWMITVPQAIRVAVPPLINQYISITKSSSLAIVIGYTDLFSVGVVAINHTGQAIDIIALLMLAYLAISLTLSAIGNLCNRAITARGTG